MYNLRRIFPALGRCIKEYSCGRRDLRTYASSRVGAYDGDGKTTVTVINKQYNHGLIIDTVNEYGFRLNNNSQILGPLAIFNKCIFSWNVANDKDISVDSLSLFMHLEPKLDVLIVGLSDFQKNNISLLPVFTEVRKYCNVEALPTERAIAAFNYLVSEGRVVGAALLPPLKITFTDHDVTSSTLRKKDLYDIEFKQEFL